MRALLIVILIAAVLFILYLAAVKPNTKRRGALQSFTRKPVAHRGLFSNPEIPENSLPAFARAVEAGLPIELDVQLTTDNQLVVFHDSTLLRVCGDGRKIYEVSYGELQKLTLFDTKEKIPLFSEVLQVIGGRVPLVMEIKPDGRYEETAALACKMLQGYGGKVCLESFNPKVLAWYRKNDPDMLRGLLATDFFKEENDQPGVIKFLLTTLMLNVLARPDFISYNYRFRGNPFFRFCRALYRPATAAWTIKNETERKIAEKEFDMIIFDSFIPEELRKGEENEAEGKD